MDILSTRWYGEGGNVDWTKHNISNDSLWVSLKTYKIDLRKSSYESFAVLHGKLRHNIDFLKEDILDRK